MRKMMKKLVGITLAAVIATTTVAPMTAMASEYRETGYKTYAYVNGKYILSSELKYTRNKKGDITKTVVSHYTSMDENYTIQYSKKPVSKSTTTYTYKKGNLVKVKESSGDYTLNKYSGKLLKSCVDYDKNGKVESTTKYKYTYKKKKLVSCQIDSDRTDGKSHTDIKYNKYGDTTVYDSKDYNSTGKLTSSYVSTDKYTYKKKMVKKSTMTEVSEYYSTDYQGKPSVAQYNRTVVCEYHTSGFKAGCIKSSTETSTSTYDPKPVVTKYTYEYKADKTKKNVGTEIVKKDGQIQGKRVITWKKY